MYLDFCFCGVNIKTEKEIKELYIWVRKSILECYISFFLQRIHIGKLRAINLWNSMQICVFCITSAKMLIFNISSFCFFLLNLIALCCVCYQVITVINNAFSVYLLEFICDTNSSISSSFLRSLLLALKPEFLTPIHIFFSETISLASVWLFGLANTLFPWIREEFLSSDKSDFMWGGKTAV